MITTANVMDASLEDLMSSCFGLLKGHSHVVTLDAEDIVARLGEYASLYQYFSELYVYMVGQARRMAELKDGYRKMLCMDKRDCLEQVLKATKMQYDALSRKVTVLSGEGQDGR